MYSNLHLPTAAVYCSLLTLSSSFYSILDKFVKVAGSRTTACHLEGNQLGIQHEVAVVLFLQLYPSTAARQILDDNHTRVIKLLTFLSTRAHA